MKKIITAGLLGGAITASLLGPGAANAAENEYVGVEPGRLVQISVERTASLPLGQAQALTEAHRAFRAGNDAEVTRIVTNIVDGPQWAIDPAIEAAAQVLPKPVGGTNGDSYTADGDGSLMQFRNTQMLQARDTARANAQAHVAQAGEVRDAIKAALTPPAN
ncbi:hypothetical protein [Mycobacterium sp. ITM-2016-00318]|uniref:hypothetical protein n=1 Tax=Mycobacterium sp. ITM-2016-00318 TaxID=2099693 RepID=UPI000CF8E1F8|nr:hypothetical protein [Mycobacterium sp. ITM-2016-00318]WNG92588.1 hypothetical protein C6A82_024930 [Mycobacterium sp. ITM-2016-00318]